MTGAEELANKLCGHSIFEIDGIADIEYDVELNTFIVVMNDGKKSR